MAREVVRGTEVQVSTEGWKQRMEDALRAGGCASQTEWVELHPHVHCWFVFDTSPERNYESCTVCVVVRRADDNNKPCKGIKTIQLRST